MKFKERNYNYLYIKLILRSRISFSFLTIILYSITYLLSAKVSHAQSSNDKSDKQYIQWVAQYPSQESDIKSGSFKKKINQILFGEKSFELIKPISLFAKDSNLLWVLDQGAASIVNFQNQESEVPQFINKKLKNFTSLVAICSISDHKLLFTDSALDKIYCIDTDKKELYPINNTISFKQPTGIAYSKTNNEIWVVETSAHQISVLNENGELIKTIGNRGNKTGEFNFPTFIWIDNLGNVYVVDSMNFRVQIFDKDGKFLSVFGEIGDATGYFARPKGIATDSYGNIYVTDALFHTIQIFDRSGNFLYQFGSQGQDKGQFWMPTGIWIDANDYIYIADSYNSRIQVFKLAKGLNK
jgi:DNA-binding beta-propeller fold protein YncE